MNLQSIQILNLLPKVQVKEVKLFLIIYINHFLKTRILIMENEKFIKGSKKMVKAGHLE